MPALSTVIHQTKNNKHKFTRIELASAIVGAFDATEKVFDRIQLIMLDLLRPLENAGKKEIINDAALNRVFVCDTVGPVRAKLLAWMEEFTPIKGKYERDTNGKRTGKILGLTIPKKNAREWNLAGAKVNPFMEFSAQSVRGLADPRVDRGIDALVREIARTIDVDETYTLKQAQEYLERELMDRLMERVDHARKSDKHEKWVERYQLEKQDAKRHVA
ncbi:MAG: hypothetical protein VBE63_08425 [Lamprobacter sp.]|uniref:hypothetical protein n=1 Tax=Lamprobacter sp. TaxID=3100796 RepID=UPI002B256F3B|nr:hypothetical protein [Lamprobacter sp.]MEA3639955.1 hypothetical protein [Lamprobacter sp.]